MKLTPKSKDISKWYNEVVLKAELADYSPVKGCMVIRPNGYGIWENVQKIFDPIIKKSGARNAYFPLFIPMSFLEKEKEHIKGFSPELAVVTKGGGEELAEPLAIRPTSETIMYYQFAKWIQSYRDLPLKINQWSNIVRWEKRTYLFLRTTEFLWQEGHTVHETHTESKKEVLRAIKAYSDLYQKHFALYGIAGKKSESEKFPGGVETYAYEILLPGGKALQACTSHDLGQKFSKAFKVQFQDRDGSLQYAWQTSWGLTTRSIGGLIIAHGDDKGLVLPFDLAPTQIIIVPVLSKKDSDEKVLEYSKGLKTKLERKYSIKLDDRSEQSFGRKMNDSELKGIPIRLEIGEGELKERAITVYRRDKDSKEKISEKDLLGYIKEASSDIQQNLLNKSKRFTEKNTHSVDSYDEFKKIMEGPRGFIRAFWCESEKCEAAIKAETKATTRCLPLDAKEENGKCIYCGAPSKHRWIFALAY